MDANTYPHPHTQKSPHDGELARGAAGIYIIETSGVFKGMDIPPMHKAKSFIIW